MADDAVTEEPSPAVLLFFSAHSVFQDLEFPSHDHHLDRGPGNQL